MSCEFGTMSDEFFQFASNNLINSLVLVFRSRTSRQHFRLEISVWKKPRCGISREKSVFANRDLLIKMISQVFHGGRRQCDCDSSSFALSFCLWASSPIKPALSIKTRGRSRLAFYARYNTHPVSLKTRPSNCTANQWKSIRNTRCSLAVACTWLFTFQRALESRISMTTSAFARVIDYHFMLGIINRIIFGSLSPIIKIIEQRPHRQKKKQPATGFLSIQRASLNPVLCAILSPLDRTSKQPPRNQPAKCRRQWNSTN